MKHFLAIFTGSPIAMSRWESLSESERNKRQTLGIAAWHKWVEDHKSSIVSLGGPLGKTKLVSPEGISDVRNAMTGCTIVEAESHDAAATLFLNHPHFTIFPGEGVQVMEVLPVPAM
jgi:hypothetical protein